jgi:hypothetical protein
MTVDEFKNILEIKRKNAAFEAVRSMLGEIIDLVDLVEFQKPKNAISKPRKPKTFKPKECECCGGMFVPNSGAQKICDDCKSAPDWTNDIGKWAEEIANG